VDTLAPLPCIATAPVAGLGRDDAQRYEFGDAGGVAQLFEDRRRWCAGYKVESADGVFSDTRGRADATHAPDAPQDPLNDIRAARRIHQGPRGDESRPNCLFAKTHKENSARGSRCRITDVLKIGSTGHGKLI
jgi:hypothetical protein